MRDYKKQGRANRNKGKRYERDCAKALEPVYPGARRLYGQSRKGADAPDVGGTPFWIECGCGGTTKIRTKLLQALRDTAASEDPRFQNRPAVVFTRTTKNEHIVSMERSQFLDLLKQIKLAQEVLEDAGISATGEVVKCRKKKSGV